MDNLGDFIPDDEKDRIIEDIIRNPKSVIFYYQTQT